MKAPDKVFFPNDINLLTRLSLVIKQKGDVCYIRADLAELTWEDIAVIDSIILDTNNELAVDYSKEISRQKFYEEILTRFKEQRKK